jgi:hypothetical protein
MFIYFPEYIYSKIKNYSYYTFNSKIDYNSLDEKLKNIYKTDLNFSTLIDSYKKNKVSFPNINLKHCNKFIGDDTHFNLGFISDYSMIDNKIGICKNMIEDETHLFRLLRKELSYALQLNLHYRNNKKTNLNDYTKFSIEACKSMISSENIHKVLKNELVKRCAILEFKFKFQEKLKNHYEEEYPEMDNLKLNELIKQLVDLNNKY